MQYNPEEFQEILNIFKVESEEIIEGLNDGFLELEKNPQDKTPLKKLFQLAHSLKGSARMLGFNSIQDISHKIEDILSLWKRDDVVINSDNFEVIYDACDFLIELVLNSVKKKSDCYTNQVSILINKLDEFLKTNYSIEKIVNENFDNNIIFEKSIDINAIILELMFVLERDDFNEDAQEIIEVIEDNLKSLNDIFTKTNYSVIKQSISDLLNIINEDRQNYTDSRFKFFKDHIFTVKNEIYKIYHELNITPVINKQKDEKISSQELNIPNKESANFDENLNKELDNVLSELKKIKSDNNYIKVITEKLQNIINNTDNDKINKILSKTMSILNLFLTKNSVIDNDCYIVILQSIYLAKSLLTEEKEQNISNLDFVLQKLSVIEDMFSVQDTLKKPENIIPVSNESVLPSNEYLNFKNNIKNFDFQEIKTLRVDSNKLDSLISQTGELLVNGIKTREHIVELSKINSKLIKWNSNSKKVINYLKYMEKKGFFNSTSDDSAVAFYKKAQNFFISNSRIINEIYNDFNALYNIIFEDDNKLHQTVLEMETIAKGIRVLPLATIFHSFPRMIRDIAKENNKKVNFVISGSDTTIDKKIIEEIKMPLVHILRNSVSHGIETPENRIKNNKNETGLIKLTAKQAENNVVLIIEDDGYGINLEKVRNTAIRKGLIQEEEASYISDEKLMKLLFIPGFSTEESITEISGRGIGLDVVKTKITNLNGDITIDSVLNKGCKVTIKLPLSMSTIKTFIILLDNQKFAIPISAVKFVKQINRNDIFNKNGQDCIIFDDRSLPVFSLSNVFEFKTEKINSKELMTVVIIENQEKRAAYIVDNLLGDQEIFQKKMVSPVLKIKNISGFSTLPTGEICLIINPYELIRNTLDDRKNSDYKNNSLTYNNKIVIYDFENTLKIFHNETETTVTVINSINSAVDYIKNNLCDVFIAVWNNSDSDLINLIKYIKSNENTSSIKIFLVSDIPEYDIKKHLDDYTPDGLIKTEIFNKESIEEIISGFC